MYSAFRVGSVPGKPTAEFVVCVQGLTSSRQADCRDVFTFGVLRLLTPPWHEFCVQDLVPSRQADSRAAFTFRVCRFLTLH